MHCVGDTNQVGSYPAGASSYGALDMSGNVREWVYDWYDADYYSSSPYKNPVGLASGSYKLLRSSDWNSLSSYSRVAVRDSLDPSIRDPGFGFRCAVSPGWPVTTSEPAPATVTPVRSTPRQPTNTPSRLQPTATRRPTPRPTRRPNTPAPAPTSPPPSG